MSASLRLPAAAAAFLLALCSCNSTPKGETNLYESDGLETEKVIEGNRDLAKHLSIIDPRARYGPGDIMEVQFDLKNNRTKSLAFQWRIDWIDHSGFVIDTNVTGWKPVKLGSGVTTTIRGVAPSAEAQSWRLQVSTPNEVR